MQFLNEPFENTVVPSESFKLLDFIRAGETKIGDEIFLDSPFSGYMKGHGWHTPSYASPARILMSLSKNGTVVIGSTLAKTLPAKSSMEFVGRQSGMRTEEFLDSFAMPTPQGLSRTFVPLSQLTICWTKATTLFSFCPALLSTSDNMWFEVTLLFNHFSPFVSMAR